MKTYTLALVGALALVAAPALSGCTTETTPDGDTATVVDGDSLDGLVDLNDSLDVDADSLGDDLGDAGAAVGGAVDSAGAAVGRAADHAEDAVDANVDLGHNAEDQGDSN